GHHGRRLLLFHYNGCWLVLPFRKNMGKPRRFKHLPRCSCPFVHFAPVAESTAGRVRTRIATSSQIDQLSMYSKSSRTHSWKSVILLRPLTCHRHVIPGLTLKRRRCARSLKRFTSSTGNGRGPTRLISPRSMLNNCGNSSRLYLRRILPMGVTRGSFVTL